MFLLVPAHSGSPGQMAVEQLCVRVVLLARKQKQLALIYYGKQPLAICGTGHYELNANVLPKRNLNHQRTEENRKYLVQAIS